MALFLRLAERLFLGLAGGFFFRSALRFDRRRLTRLLFLPATGVCFDALPLLFSSPTPGFFGRLLAPRVFVGFAPRLKFGALPRHFGLPARVVFLPASSLDLIAPAIDRRVHVVEAWMCRGDHARALDGRRRLGQIVAGEPCLGDDDFRRRLLSERVSRSWISWRSARSRLDRCIDFAVRRLELLERGNGGIVRTAVERPARGGDGVARLAIVLGFSPLGFDEQAGVAQQRGRARVRRIGAQRFAGGGSRRRGVTRVEEVAPVDDGLVGRAARLELSDCDAQATRFWRIGVERND